MENDLQAPRAPPPIPHDRRGNGRGAFDCFIPSIPSIPAPYHLHQYLTPPWCPQKCPEGEGGGRELRGRGSDASSSSISADRKYGYGAHEPRWGGELFGWAVVKGAKKGQKKRGIKRIKDRKGGVIANTAFPRSNRPSLFLSSLYEPLLATTCRLKYFPAHPHTSSSTTPTRQVCLPTV